MATLKYPGCDGGLHLFKSEEAECFGLQLPPPDQDRCIHCNKTFDVAVIELHDFLFLKQLGISPYEASKEG